jgi:hypothetical protein
MPTVHTLDAQVAQFVWIRSVEVKTCDYGSGGRGFESLPARNPKPSLRPGIRAISGGFVLP